jgi:hypothetical protein
VVHERARQPQNFFEFFSGGFNNNRSSGSRSNYSNNSWSNTNSRRWF